MGFMIPLRLPFRAVLFYMKDNTFQCAYCQEIFPQERDILCAREEAKSLFPDDDWKEMPLVCEPCFIRIMDFNEPNLRRYEPFISSQDLQA
jgi:hypothetical protein